MTPSNHDNLDRFVQCFEQAKVFGLTFAIDERTGEMPMLHFYAVIQENLFSVVEEWRLGRNAPRLTAIPPEDNVIIPADQLNAPVIEAVEWLK